MMATTTLLKLTTAVLLACGTGAANAAAFHPSRRADAAAAAGDSVATDSQYLTTLVTSLYQALTGGDATTTTADSTVVDNCAALVFDSANQVGFSVYGLASTENAEEGAMAQCTESDPGADAPARHCEVITSFCSDDCVGIAFRYDWGNYTIGTGMKDDAGYELPYPASTAMMAPMSQCTFDACAQSTWAPLCAKGIPVCYVDYLVCGLGSVEYADYTTGKLQYNAPDDVDLARFPVGDFAITTIMDLTAAPEGGFPLKLGGAASSDTATADTTTTDTAVSAAPATEDVPAVDGTDPLTEALGTAAELAGSVTDVVDSALSGDLSGLVDALTSATR